MNVIHSLTDAQKRKRRPDSRVLDDGEAIGFNIALVRDAAPAGTASAYLTDTANITRRADFTCALAAARFADDAKLIKLPEGSTRGIDGTSNANAPTRDAPPARASIHVLRIARYS